jgi:hypothetical protein
MGTHWEWRLLREGSYLQANKWERIFREPLQNPKPKEIYEPFQARQVKPKKRVKNLEFCLQITLSEILELSVGQ